MHNQNKHKNKYDECKTLTYLTHTNI